MSFKPNKLERNQPVWIALIEHLEARLAYLRTQNDGDLDAVTTASHRGRIAEIKALLSLDQDEKQTD